jgi:4-amino-4-deoxy-L-arabinose transferase
MLFQKDKIVFALFLIVFCGLLLRIYSSSDLFLHEWDERYHALVAKNLIRHPLTPTLSDPNLPYDYQNWTNSHIWLHKQPLPLWTMALSMWLFGINEIALRLPSIILSTMGIWLTYSIGRHLFNPKVGIIGAFLYSINGLIIEMAAGRVPTDHIDIFFLFFIQLAVWLAIKFATSKKFAFNLLCGVSIGCAILCKWFPAFIVLPLWILFVMDARNFKPKEIITHFLLLCLVIVSVFLPWQLYIHSAFPKEAAFESDFNLRHITEALDNHTGPFYYYFDNMRMIFGELVYIPVLWFLWKTIKRKRNYRRWALIVWFLFPYFFFSFVKTKMSGYILFTAPSVFLITGVFWYYLYRYKSEMKYKWLTYSILFFLIALPLRYSIERIKPFEFRNRNPQWTQEIRNLGKRYHSTKTAVLNNAHPIETMFYTDFIACSHIPDTSSINNLLEKGYKVIIIDNGKLEGKVYQKKGIEIIDVPNLASD